jgi:hypothetical protein
VMDSRGISAFTRVFDARLPPGDRVCLRIEKQPSSHFVMAGLVPAIHVFTCRA